MPTDLRPIAVILNAGSGTGRAEAVGERITELCAAAGPELLLALCKNPEQLREAIDQAIRANAAAVVAGGGDGTVSFIAGALAGRDIPLGVLPLGTLNHFAKDLGIPLDLDSAIAVVLAGRTERVDVGEVNGHVFLNNSSLGLYPLIVRLRAQHPVRGPLKWAVAAWATLQGIRRHRELSVRIDTGGTAVVRRTPILFIGNNAYRAEGVEAGSRDSLQDGRLALYIVKEGGGRRLFRMVWRMLVSKRPRQDMEVLLTEAATIETRDSRVLVAVDGEVLGLESPLEYRIRPGALSVLVPPAPLA